VHPFEEGLRIGTRWVVAGSAGSLIGLVIDSDRARLSVVWVHLVLLTVGVIALTLRLTPTFEQPAFTSAPPVRSRFATDAALVALVTGATALVTLASSAALRYQPSLQFLQLISAMDIAWTTAGFAIGVGRIEGRWRLPAGVFMGAMCVMSLVRYLAATGFGPDGGWDVQGPTMVRMVIPADVVAALLTVAALTLGARRWAAQPTEQRSPQS
jgi:hypothetical protein